MKKRNSDAGKPGAAHDAHVTSEVGSEGGSPGDIETGTASPVGHGSEATELWKPDDPGRVTIVHDETGSGRRNP